MNDLAKIDSISPRLASIARLVPHQIKLVKLSKKQLDVLQAIVKEDPVTAKEISKRCQLSLSWSSTLLKQLHERHYLIRCDMKRERGGIEFSYTKLD